MALITTRVTNASVAGVGTITCTTASPVVTGVGTSFLTSVIIGQQITNSGGTVIGTVLTVDSNTQITLVANATTPATAEAYNVVSTGITTKGSPLSNAEIDANFININNAVVAGANSSVNNVPNTLVKRGPSGEFSAGVATLTGANVGGTTVPTSNASQAQMETGTDTTTRYMSPNNIKQAIDVLAMQTVGSVTKDMTGFESLSGSSISYVDATRVFTLAPSGTTATSRTFSVTASGGKFYIDGVMQATLDLLEGGTYTFDQSDASNTGHPLRFSITANGTHGGGVEYTTNVTTNGTPGQAGAYTRIIVPSGAPTLYYYCTNHSGMGGQLNTIQGYYVWYRGKRTLMTTSLTTTLTATAGNHYIGINPTTMTLEVFNTASDTLFSDTILVANIYLDTATTKALIVGDERHSSARDTSWHVSQHNNMGAIWRSGGALTYTVNSDAAVGLSFATPIFLADEDLVHSINHASSPNGYYQQVLNGTANIQTLYLNGTTYSLNKESTVPWVAGTATAAINTVTSGSGALADAGEGKFLNYWIVATNDKNSPIKAIMGRNSYNSVTESMNEQFQDYGLPFLEFAPMYKVTLQTAGSYTGNVAKVRIVSVRTVSMRQSAINQTFKEPAHSELSNLGSDDHSQYVHISTARTITAAHTFSGNNTFQGTQGFNNITVAGVGSHMIPTAASTYDLGSTTFAWRHVYTSDLHLSNEKHETGNMVDGTRGNWTIQEGDEVLYIINNKNGKRYKFSLEEV